MPTEQIVAAFDFDGTLTRKDTFTLFLKEISGQLEYVKKVIRLIPILTGYQMGWINNTLMKEHVLTMFLRGRTLHDLLKLAEQFGQSLPQYLRPEAVNRLHWHQRQGHLCVIVSASLGLYLRPLQAILQVDHLLASELEIAPTGLITGKLIGGNCYGTEKTRRLQSLLGARETYLLYAYGDSRGDRELLADADSPFYRVMP